MSPRRIVPVSVLALSALALAGCASGAPSDTGESAGGDAATLSIVASTNVYGSIAKALVGDAADVTSLIDSSSADPHEYEATARDQLAVDEADILILNGGGYDEFFVDMAETASPEKEFVVASYSENLPEGADVTGEIEGFNEHVWYDPATVAVFVQDLRDELVTLLPDSQADIESAAETLLSDIGGVTSELDALAAEKTGGHVFLTEPVGGYLIKAAGLEDATVDGFQEAVEEEQDVPPATLLAATESIEDGDIDVIIANTQTGGAETDAVVKAAETADVPVIQFGETLPDGDDYAGWMTDNIDALSSALSQ